ncbi:MAG TPA: 2-oxoacid:acceptor oxidoreductase family protein [Candidatus Omnitrophota bacterium]|nr:2-oxoacid:acceptor oxidoreductase family protein [Candidatus Omnitrophota bacterium]HPT07151.1 2-oxoacid:acceptor oxidoreductase family protein [Candidatus Omnitrophota bacterium]
MTEKVLIAGAGGQGVMLLGKILTEAAMQEGKFTTWLPAYGAEVRGGTSYCMVIISDEEIGSPYIEQADTLIVLNEPSMEKFRNRLKRKGVLIVNSTLVPAETTGKAAAAQYPFTDIAMKLGNVRIANMVALGSYVAMTNVVSVKIILGVIDTIAPADKKGLVAVNQKAVLEGEKLVR